MKNSKRIISWTITLIMAFTMLPANVSAANAPIMDVPIPEYFEIVTQGYPADIPQSGLSAGQVWFDKDVKVKGDRKNGEFEITLYVWGARCNYRDIDGKSILNALPLGPNENETVDITDYVGSQFTPVGASSGYLSITADKVILRVPQKEICGPTPYAITFTVKLNKGWDAETTYYTNENPLGKDAPGAFARFKPVKGNPYYYKEGRDVENVFTIGSPNWNDKGIDNLTIIDKELFKPESILFSFSNGGSNVVVIDGKTFTRASVSQQMPPPQSEYNKLVYGFYITTAPADILAQNSKAKTYVVWLTGLEGNALTEYKMTVLNNGGNVSTMAQAAFM